MSDLAIKRISDTGLEYRFESQNSVSSGARPRESGVLKDASEARKDLPAKEVDQIASDVQLHLKRLNTELRLEVDGNSDKVVVKIVDPVTKQIIRQIPSEELLEISKRMEEIIGVLFKSKT